MEAGALGFIENRPIMHRTEYAFCPSAFEFSCQTPCYSFPP